MNPVKTRWFVGAAAVAAEQSLEFEHAARDFPEANGRFARLADAGHVPSAFIALLMVRKGRTLFPNDGFATPDQIHRWTAMTTDAPRQMVKQGESDA